MLKVSDAIALFLKNKNIDLVFGIIGSANSHIFDSINNLGYTKIICVHHEQAATMAMQTYFRVSGKISAAIVTAGGGSANAITGVMSSWADSLPGIVISGQENLRFINSMGKMRMYGIQGFNIAEMVKNITKYSKMVASPEKSIYELEKAYEIALKGRPGPVWIDFPMDIQGAKIPNISFKKFKPKIKEKSSVIDKNTLKNIKSAIESSKRPVFWLGNGIRLSMATNRIENLLKTLPFPTILSWAAIDILGNDHPLNYGRAGVYGNRSANFILQNSDLVIAIGTRLAIPMIGYEHSELCREAKVIQVDIDQTELDKISDIADIAVCMDAGAFIDSLLANFSKINNNFFEWKQYCSKLRDKYPLIGPEHQDTRNYINSYKFINKLSEYLNENSVITTDMGTALLSGHEAFEVKLGQRFMTSTGLGEMGFGLPAAIGASFAKDKSEVICLNCDGGMMMNLQELQTIVHHNLPIKIFIFNNDGYLMIKHTQKNLFEGRYSAVDEASGVSCPDFGKIANAFNINYFSINSWKDLDRKINDVLEEKGPVICDIFMDPEQFFHPKLSLAMNSEGQIISPPLEDLSPLLSREEFKSNMIIDPHDKSLKIID